MNCEQVKELLSAYLDNALAPEEDVSVKAHLQRCIACSTILEDYRRFDALLAQTSRVSPPFSLKQRIFSSPRYLELTATLGGIEKFRKTRTSTVTLHRHPNIRPLRVMQVLIAASILLTLAVGAFIGRNLIAQQEQRLAKDATGIIPPAGLQQEPIPAGTRFIFSRDGALWSAPIDGGTNIIRLTPTNVTVANNWMVRPALPGRIAGNMLAYIDLRKGFVHIIRSDGQNDTTIVTPLLKSGAPSTVMWNTDMGATLLNGLSWSPDGSTLAFVAVVQGTGLPGLYIDLVETGEVRTVPLPATGSVSHPVWSSDSRHIAFELNKNGNTSIIDYNTQNHNVVTVISTTSTSSDPDDTILSLNWSPNLNLTWSVGVAGHIHSVWMQHVATGSNQLLTSGDYIQALYNRTGDSAQGSWLLVNSHNGQPGDITSIDLADNATTLTVDKQASSVQPSPDGMYIDYLNMLSAGFGELHVINVNTGIDTLVTKDVTNTPMPVWSPDNQHLIYSTGSHILVVDTHSLKAAQLLKVQGTAADFSWSVTDPHQIVLSTSGKEHGIFLADTESDSSLRLDQRDLHGPISWTQIP